MDTNILETILTEKRREVSERSAREDLPSLKKRAALTPPTAGFVRALESAPFPAVIAEVKRASPSKGVIRPDLNTLETARGYVRGQAACLSVLTDEKFFQGSLEALREIRAALPGTPVLRKDFTCDPYQVWETRAAGADAILLIVAALDDGLLERLTAESIDAGLDILLEVHNAEELDRVVPLMPHLERAPTSRGIVGINNRDLKSFVTDLAVTERVLEHGRKSFPRFESLLIVSESGIRTGADVARLSKAGARAFLVGESLVASGDPGENLERLIEEAKAK